MTEEQARMLRTVIDRQEIENLLTRYARAIDRLDIELLRSVYHPDARDDHANFTGTAHEFAEHAIGYLADAFVATMHHVTHSNIEIRGDEAAAESYYYAYHRLEGDHAKVARVFGRSYADASQAEGTLGNGHDFICGGRYVDRLSRRDGEWRIAKREITVEWKHTRPQTLNDPGSEIDAIVAPPGRDRSDLAYRFFAEIGA